MAWQFDAAEYGRSARSASLDHDLDPGGDHAGGVPRVAPGKRALTDRLVPRADTRALERKLDWVAGVVQRLAGSGLDPTGGAVTGGPDEVQRAARQGVDGAGGPLPHLDRIQDSFGPDHDLSTVQAHVGGAAAEAAVQIGAEAYATGDRVAFRATPSLHTAAHEAAHVIQQRAGVQLDGGVGRTGDRYELDADAVADRVVAGQSAADLLPGSRPAPAELGDTTGVVQRRTTTRSKTHERRSSSRSKPKPLVLPSPLERPRTPAQVTTLIARLYGAIRRTETGTKVTESKAGTSAGVKASYKSEVQVTAGWTIDAIRHLPAKDRNKLDKKDLALFTRTRMARALKRARAAGALWKKAMAGRRKKLTASAFLARADVKALLKTSGLTAKEVGRMLVMRDLRIAIEATGRKLGLAPSKIKDRKKRLAAARRIAAALWKHPATKLLATTLGLHQSTVAMYARGKKWAEDRNAWERLALEKDKKFGAAFRRVTEHGRGRTIAFPKISRRTRAYLRSHPLASDMEVVLCIANQHHTGKLGVASKLVGVHYPKKVWGKFRRAQQPRTPGRPHPRTRTRTRRPSHRPTRRPHVQRRTGPPRPPPTPEARLRQAYRRLRRWTIGRRRVTDDAVTQRILAESPKISDRAFFRKYWHYKCWQFADKLASFAGARSRGLIRMTNAARTNPAVAGRSTAHRGSTLQELGRVRDLAVGTSVHLKINCRVDSPYVPNHDFHHWVTCVGRDAGGALFTDSLRAAAHGDVFDRSLQDWVRNHFHEKRYAHLRNKTHAVRDARGRWRPKDNLQPLVTDTYVVPQAPPRRPRPRRRRHRRR